MSARLARLRKARFGTYADADCAPSLPSHSAALVAPCPRCGERGFWRRPPGPWRCDRCEPPAEARPGDVFTWVPPEPVPSDACRHCGEPVDWQHPGALVFADGSAAHLTCADRAEVARLLAAGKRAVESPDELADEAEVTLRGELP